jgi:hypothetical protein
MSDNRRTHSQELVLQALVVEIDKHDLEQSWGPQHLFALEHCKEAFTIVISVHTTFVFNP